MTPQEVTRLLEACSIYQRNIADGDPVALRDAWYLALDMRMTLEEGLQIVVSLAAGNEWLNPGTINERFLAKYRKPHELGTGRAKLPGQNRQEPKAAPLEVGSAMPVRPQDVPEYVAARKAATEAGARRQPASWALKCPHCGAMPGRPCTVQVGEEKRALKHREAHPAREVALQVVSSRPA